MNSMTNEGPDLRTTYLGLELRNPIVPSAGPYARSVDSAKALEEAGAAAIVAHSLFEEEVQHEELELAHYLEHGTESSPEAIDYFPDAADYQTGPKEYLEHIRRLKASLKIPVIGSLNGVTSGGWVEYAQEIQQAGADALELNVYTIPADLETDGREIEDHTVAVLAAVKSRVTIPVAIKLSPFYSAMGHMARRLDEAGADGLVLFNRFYQPDIDLETLEVYPNVKLSTPQALRLPLRWLAILHGRVKASLAASSAIHQADDALKMLLVGADIATMCSAILQRGPEAVTEVLTGIREWMTEKEYESVEQLKGSMSHRSTSDPTAFERANYMKALTTYR